MNNKLIIGMVWYTSKAYREKVKWFNIFYHPDYIPIREKLLSIQLKNYDFEFWYYQPTDTEIRLNKNVLNEQVDNIEIKTARHHNSQIGLLQLAILAEEKKADFIYIEQDCLVCGLDKVINESKNDKIRFGGKEFALHNNWAEQSFIYLNNLYLDSFIDKMFYAKLWKNGAPEPRFNQLFKNDCNYWDFGYGRIRPIDYEKDIFYSQQMNLFEYNKVKKTIEGRYGN